MKRTLILLVFICLCSCVEESAKPYKKLHGLAFGTSFNINVNDARNEVEERSVDSLIHLMNRSLSTYIPNSDISKINSGDSSITVDVLFEEVFLKAKRVYQETGGAFDPTIGILVNAWGFGPGKSLNAMNGSTIDSLMSFVGFDQVELKNHKVIKKHPSIYLDFNASAKGFGVDLIGRYLESLGIRDYMVEIGGEIRARGNNSKGMPWKIGIEEPNFDGSRSFQTIIELKNESIATSGNYRKFLIDSVTGEKYAHTIDTKTGYPSRSNLLSASVIAPSDCADVDAYATAFMAMGLDNSVSFLQNHPNLKALFIYSEKDGSIHTFSTENLSTE